jgi:hypothetical protein
MHCIEIVRSFYTPHVLKQRSQLTGVLETLYITNGIYIYKLNFLF